MNNIFYIYFHINPIKKEVFYVGKGSGNRAYHKHNKTKFWNNIVNKYGYEVKIIHSNLSESKSFELEKWYIKKIGRRDLNTGTLVNLSDGGEGVSGKIWTEESKQKMRNSVSGEKNHRYGTKASKKTRRKMSLAKKGKPKSKEHIRKVAQALTGKKRKPISERHKMAISKALTGKKRPKDVKSKISKSLIGHTISAETRKKISNTLQGNIPWNKGLKTIKKQ